MKKALILILSVLLTVCPALSLYGCAQKFEAASLMDGIKAKKIEKTPLTSEFTVEQTRFALELITEASKINDGKNTMVSPLSVMLALSMTANGAGGNTLAQMEDVLGGDLAIDELNNFLYSYAEGLPSSKKSELSIANSIWFRDSEALSVKKEFLQKNADYYGADAYKAKFDNETVNDINSWVKKNTKGMIDKVIDSIPDTMMLYLINTIAFEAEWQSKYDKHDIRGMEFTSANGEKQTVDMLCGKENKYLELENAIGFKKNYVGGDYSFAALLPKEGMTPEELLLTLDPEELNSVLLSPQTVSISTSMPAFEADYSEELSDILKTLGMTDAFGPEADFSNMSDSDLYIGSVVHKTYIKVDASGTKAGAVTSVGAELKSAPNISVVLNRPFLYMIVDNVSGLPIFIGILNSVK